MKFYQNTILLAIFLGFCSISSAQTLLWSKKANPASLTINGLAFRNDGQKVVSGTNCHPASIRIFDISAGSLEWDYTVGSNFMCIMGVAMSSNSRFITAVEEFGNLFIFDYQGAQPSILDTLSTGTSYAFSTSISPQNDLVAVGCSDGRLKIYELNTGSLQRDIAAHIGWVTTVAWSANGQFLVTGGSDNLVKIWSATGTLLFSLTGHGGDISAVKVTPDNSFVVSGSKDDRIRVWNASNGQLVRQINAHSADVNGIDLSPDGQFIVSASSDNTCKIWSLASGSQLLSFGVADSGSVTAVAWSPLGDKIATGNERSDLVLWSIPQALSTQMISDQPLFRIYPNPATDLINILYDGMDIQEIQIIDMVGKTVMRIPPEERIISLSQLEQGMYSIQITTNTKKTQQLFIKH